ncbi:MAG: hypothetical protein OH319_01760 [Candidatus Parvarchaeota archaeon]|nr:hypothetical protein [Candidatus Jingweiarchaeum tengchongense]MCW1298095.1 hypothetical protein [Candidatus Jingweiarchaeum tengchongense]MCW1300789.1 hypothetical protein [Candidatus Jingweiarchaeum tengchongense]MCW1304923.1 hypothetical protein [Candidatus Jingweiarchaeum tengchongense]MCW1305517.1 hypothetical protein [Candidatus Jingweiarchaeum tengchongense]
MIFGIGESPIDVVVEKYNYSPGETIKGKVILKLKKPTKAKQLKVALIGEKMLKEMQVTSASIKSKERKREIYRFEIPLDREKEYLTGEYTFEIKIPSNLMQTLPEGAAGEIIKTIQILAGSESITRWYVKAYLDIPLGLDISKQIQINIA